MTSPVNHVTSVLDLVQRMEQRAQQSADLQRGMEYSVRMQASTTAAAAGVNAIVSSYYNRGVKDEISKTQKRQREFIKTQEKDMEDDSTKREQMHDASVLIDRADNALKGDRYEEANANYSAILDFENLDQSTMADVFLMRGSVLCKLQDFEGAIEDFDEAIRLRKNNTDALELRATARMRLNIIKGEDMPPAALADLDAAVKLNSNGHILLGKKAFCEKNWQLAVDNFGKASERLRSNIDHEEIAEVFEFRGRCHTKLGDYRNAIEAYELAIFNTKNINTNKKQLEALWTAAGEACYDFIQHEKFQGAEKKAIKAKAQHAFDEAHKINDKNPMNDIFAAEAGDVEKQKEIAEAYYLGKNRAIPQNYGKALQWCRKIILSNNSSCKLHAYHYLGYMYSNGGFGVERNLNEAVKNYKEGAKLNDSSAFNLWNIHTTSDCAAINLTQAALYLRQAADSNSLESRFKLVAMYDLGMRSLTENGRVILRNEADAKRYLQGVADAQDADDSMRRNAAYELGSLLLLQYKRAPVDAGLLPDAHKYLKFAMEKKIDRAEAKSRWADVNFLMGERAQNSRQAEAVGYYKTAAEQDHVCANLKLGYLYKESAFPGVESNSSESRKHFKIAKDLAEKSNDEVLKKETQKAWDADAPGCVIM